MFDVSVPQDYGITESIALVTSNKAKGTALYQKIKLAFAEKYIWFQDVTLDDYQSVTIMQEDNHYAFPFLIISDGLIREILSGEKALLWINEQKTAMPMYNGYMLYLRQLPCDRTNYNSVNKKNRPKADESINIDFIESEEVSNQGNDSDIDSKESEEASNPMNNSDIDDMDDYELPF